MTELKLDLFAVSCSNADKNHVLCLPEGHWPGNKSANEVLSMLHCIMMNLNQEFTKASTKNLVIHCDNCAGQNRNLFGTWFCSCLVLNGMFSGVELNFLVAGHT